MAAPKGNKFWLLRSEHGREKLFATPQLMWEAACEYFEWCIAHPLYEVKPMTISGGLGSGSSIEKVKVPHTRVFTMQGLCRYLGCNTSYFAEFKRNLKKEDVDFSAVIQQIEETVYEQKFSGAASGFFNANLISRDLGLKDQQDVTSGDKPIAAPNITITHLNTGIELKNDEADVDGGDGD